MQTPEYFTKLGANTLPGHLGIVITHTDVAEVRAEMEANTLLMAPNGFLHAGSVITLADTAAGIGCVANLPDGASGFTTLEIKSNHLSTAREGIIECSAKLIHRGKTTQVWDAVISHKPSGKTIALFRCTQMILYPKP
ncbi:MAG: PaaI family thioesterase [Arenimonas sp.]